MVITSIICWKNKEEGESVWAVSDSRVTGSNGRMTDNCPKLFKIDLKVFPIDDVSRLSPRTLFSFGFGFSGSTLIGMSVKEILSAFVSSLNEVKWHGQGASDIQSKTPSLKEIALLTKKIAEKYIGFMAVCYPDNCRCEISLFGFCLRENKYKIFRLSNKPESPLHVECEDVSDDGFLILGDQKEKIVTEIIAMRNKFEKNGLNWWRAPFIVLSNIVREDRERAIGGYMQFLISAGPVVQSFYMSNSGLDSKLIGFDLFQEAGVLGGFLISPGAGMSLPGENGWDL